MTLTTGQEMAIERCDVQWLRTNIRGLKEKGLLNMAAVLRRTFQDRWGWTLPLNDTSRPGKPAKVVTRERLLQTSIFTPDGGLLVTFRFERDALQLAETLFNHIERSAS